MTDPDPGSMMMPSLLFNVIIPSIIPLLFLLITAIINLCDEAFSAVGETRFRELADLNVRRAQNILSFTEKERQFTSRVRLNTLLCSIIGTIGITQQTSLLAEALLRAFGGVMGYTFTAIIAYVFLFLIAVALFGAFGVILPRRLAHINAEAAALLFAGIFGFFHSLFYPLYGICRLLSWPFIKMTGMDPKEDPDTVTEDDIIELIEDVEEIGALEESQKDMLNNIFAFDDITAAEIMTPRTDMATVEVTDPVVEALATAVEHGYSRLPVYEEDIDHVIGVLYIKDLLPYVGRAIPKSVTIRKLLRDTMFVPDTKKCDELFEEMNEKHLQMSIVVDEYGGVAGIVTIEDLLESIVGNMQDEFDNEEEEVNRLDDDSFEVDGTLNIGELSELLHVEFPEGDYDTVAGLVLHLLGQIPEEESETVVEYKDVSFTVLEMEDRRIERVLIKRTPDDPNQTEV